MKRRMLAMTMAAGLLLVGSGYVLAQDMPMAGSSGMQRMMMQGPAGRHQGMPGGGHGQGMYGRGHAGPAGAVIKTLGRIEHIYRMQGKMREVRALYEDVLKKTQNPMVRRYAYKHLARAQMQPADTRQAIATLRKSLDESLNLLNAADARRAARMGQGPGPMRKP